jgi:hypothetical protein
MTSFATQFNERVRSNRSALRPLAKAARVVPHAATPQSGLPDSTARPIFRRRCKSCEVQPPNVSWTAL